ncbi:MAG: recombination protein RecR [Myxococcales bacterium]|nr:recombination protein RecR [Myxococcales bacterium]
MVNLFGRLPGIGERTATRLAFHVLDSDSAFARALGESLTSIHARVRRCVDCGNFGTDARCPICSDPRRDPHAICVVARVPDLVAIERSGTFRGRYHVLHGLLAPLDGVGPDALPLDALTERVKRDSVREVIVATPLSVEGEATALYVSRVLEGTGASVSRIASGVPHGGELEFTDQVTLGRAFEGRRAI